MAALIAPRLIVRCEGSSRSAPGDGFDAQIYEKIFDLKSALTSASYPVDLQMIWKRTFH